MTIAVGYVVAFTCLALTLQAGMGLGVALTADASRVLFKEPLNCVMAIGIMLIMGGMLLVATGGVH